MPGPLSMKTWAPVFIFISPELKYNNDSIETILPELKYYTPELKYFCVRHETNGTAT